MEHQNNGQHPIEDHDNSNHPAANTRAPSTLVSAVLSRIGLDGEAVLPSSDPGAPIAALNSSDWRVRAAAIRALEMTQATAARELFLAALHDGDSTVRATAVHALGTIGGQAAVDSLTAALLDPDWHIRETAALALGKLAQDIPLEPLLTTLHDTDSTVREAAHMALQWRQSGSMTAPQADVEARSASPFQHAQTVQQRIPPQRMQALQQESTIEPQKTLAKTFKAVYQSFRGNAAKLSDGEKHNTDTSTGKRMQEYENRELQYYGEETTTRWDKVTSYTPRRARNSSLRRIGIVSAIVLAIAAVNAVAFGLYTYTSISRQEIFKIPTFAVMKPNPNSTLGNTLYTFRGHQDTVNAVAWSPDSTRIASASDDQTVQVWDALTGNNRIVYGGHTAKVTTVAWSPDGTRVASGDLHGTVQIWNPTNGSLYLTYRFQAAATVDSHIGALQVTSGGGDPGVYSVVWSPDGKSIAAAMGSNLVRVFDARTGRTGLTYAAPSGKINALAWSPDGMYIVVASSSIPTTVWNVRSGQSVFTYPENDQDAEFSLAWSPNSKSIALGNIDGTVRLWDPLTNNILAYKGQSMNIFSLAWSPDGTRIASGSIDDTVQIWDVSTLTTLFTYRGHMNELRAVSWSPNGQYIASGSSDQTVQVWQAAS